MINDIVIDSQSNVVAEHYAIIYTAKRNRKRFPANCVTIVDSAEQATERESSADKLFSAKVIGPSRSSEGLQLYYLVEWLSS